MTRQLGVLPSQSKIPSQIERIWVFVDFMKLLTDSDIDKLIDVGISDVVLGVADKTDRGLTHNWLVDRSWAQQVSDNASDYLRAANRNAGGPSYYLIGFRCARVPVP